MTSLACTVDVDEVIDALESDHAAPEHRLPGLSNDPSFGLVAFREQVRAQMPAELVRAAADPTCPRARLVRFPCGTNVMVPAGATPDIVEALYVDARLNLILWLVVPRGTA